MRLAYLLTVLSSTAMAQIPSPTPSSAPRPPLVNPDIRTLVGPAAPVCPIKPTGHPVVWVLGQDPQTGNWIGMAWAQVYCHEFYHGCADVVWDPTGATILTYKSRFQEKKPDYATKREQNADINKRCFDNKFVGID